jgi:hypothetical protein
MNTNLTLCGISWLIAITLAVPSAAGEPFNKTYQLQGYSFSVVASNEGSINQLKITPSGLKNGNEPIDVEIDGSVTGADIGDLDANGFPEIYVFVTSAGSGSYGSLVAYAVNKGKSISPIYLPPITDDAEVSRGYMGHDEFAVLENVLGRRFPIYEASDANAQPSGKTRQLQYGLFSGEAGWVMRIKDITEY